MRSQLAQTVEGEVSRQTSPAQRASLPGLARCGFVPSGLPPARWVLGAGSWVWGRGGTAHLCFPGGGKGLISGIPSLESKVVDALGGVAKGWLVISALVLLEAQAHFLGCPGEE